MNMTIGDWLKHSQQNLTAAGIGTARLDALVLLEDELGRDRAWLLAHPEYEIPAANARVLTNLLKRRAKHEPLAYLRGSTEFYGREFLLTASVLQPRPESETMIDLFKSLPVFGVKGRTQPNRSKQDLKVVDIGTGSGALGITAALEVPGIRVDLADIDPKALKVAQMNVDKFTLNVGVLKSDLLADIDGDYDIMLCNLPYVPDDFKINAAAGHEPRLAIFGGPDGLNVYRKLFNQLKNRPVRPLYILSEALPAQHDELERIAGLAGFKLERKKDFIQVFTTA